MRIAAAQINSELGHFEANKIKIIETIQEQAAKRAELIIFPEASLFGYQPYDLLERSDLVKEQLKHLKEITKEIPKDVYVIIGGFDINENRRGRPFFNTAFLCTKNKIVKKFYKELLPTGDVFDEARFIEKGSVQNNFFKIKSKNFFVTICEDIWAWDYSKKDRNQKISEYPVNPLKSVKKSKVDLVINISASPFFKNKEKKRQHMAAETAKHFKAPIMYVNMVGAQDEVIYDGSSFLMDKKGKVVHQLQSFNEDSNVFELGTLETWTRSAKSLSQIEQIRQALVLGIRDFVKKTGFKKVHLGLSGGIDSAVVAVLAADAVGASNVKLLALPTRFNEQKSYDVALKLAQNIGSELQVVSIDKNFESLKGSIDESFNLKEFSLVHENLQSRIRGLILMSYSNITGSLLLTTGNKSEYATGYATLYGDMCGGLAVLGDLTKHEVYALAKHYNAETEIIPDFIITRPPSAELRPNQKDQDSLPPYDDLDAAVERLVEEMKPAQSKTEKWLLPRLMKSEFKRWQAPPILKVSEHAFGKGRRYPIAHK